MTLDPARPLDYAEEHTVRAAVHVWAPWSVRAHLAFGLIRFAVGLIFPWIITRDRHGRAHLRHNQGGTFRAHYGRPETPSC